MGFWTSEKMHGDLPPLIEPFDSERIVNCSYELSMGPEAYVTSSDTKKRQVLADKEQVLIPSGQFAHLLTEEHITVPLTAIGLISIKSKYKLSGLVNVSGFHVDPGYKGRLVFSVYNAGTSAIIITKGVPIFLLWLSTLEGTTDDSYEGGRLGLTSLRDAEIMQLQGDVSTPQALAGRIAKLEDRLRWRHDIFLVVVGALVGAVLTGATNNLKPIVDFFRSAF